MSAAQITSSDESGQFTPVCPVGRFLLKIEVAESGCWEWQAELSRDGYAMFCSQGRYGRAQRWAYRQWVGLIPSGLHIDHLCRNRACVNPAHLEPVTCRENLARGENFHRNQTHCDHGHPFSGENLIVGKDGKRRCRECQREQGRRRRNLPERREYMRDYFRRYRARLRAESQP